MSNDIAPYRQLFGQSRGSWPAATRPPRPQGRLLSWRLGDAGVVYLDAVTSFARLLHPCGQVCDDLPFSGSVRALERLKPAHTA